MDTISGYTRTGRVLLGPGSDLVELSGDGGRRLTAIVFHPEHRKHNAINAALSVVLGFLESPMVSGLTDMTGNDREQGAFVYATGHTWSVAEVIRTLADQGSCAGVRAGVELMVAIGQVLVEAAEVGESAGVYSHGGLTPWRVLLDAQGNAQVIGHALPQVEILTFHEDPSRVPREDAFRYCPPERMESKRENFSSDLFGLALIAFELMTGKPVYDGLVNDIRSKAARGETSRRIHQFREILPDPVQRILTTALRPDIRDRHQNGTTFLDDARVCLGHPSVQGATLREVMGNVSRYQPRAKQDLDPARTSMLSKEELARLAQDDDAPARPARGTVAPETAKPAAKAEPPKVEPPKPAAPPAVRPAPSSSASRPAVRPPPSRSEGVGTSSSIVRAPARTASDPPEQLPTATPVQAVTPTRSVQGEPVEARPAGRPPIGVARPPPSRRTVAEEPAPAPAPSRGNESPDELLARLGTSGNGSKATPSAQAVLDEILSPQGALPPPNAQGVEVLADAARSGSTPSGRVTEAGYEVAADNYRGRRDPGDPTWMASQFEQAAKDAKQAAVKMTERSKPAAPVEQDDGRMSVEIGGGPKVERAVAGVDGGSVFSDSPAPEAAKPVVATFHSALRGSAPAVAKPKAEAAPPGPPTPPMGARTINPGAMGAGAAPKVEEQRAEAPKAPEVVKASEVVKAPEAPKLPEAPKGMPLVTMEIDEDEGGATTAFTKEQLLANALAEEARELEEEIAKAAAKEAAAKEAAAKEAAAKEAAAKEAAAKEAAAKEAAAKEAVAKPAERADAAAWRTPDPLKSSARGDLVALRISRGPAAAAARRRLPAHTTLAEAVHLLVGSFVPLRTTPDGRLLGWYRLGGAAGPLPPERTVGSVGETELMILHPVENQLLSVDVRVEEGARMRLVVGSAVPVGALVDGFSAMFDLPPGEWTLHLDGAALDPFHVLADRTCGPKSQLVLRKATSPPA